VRGIDWRAFLRWLFFIPDGWLRRDSRTVVDHFRDLGVR
jgi:hypothetical protein